MNNDESKKATEGELDGAEAKRTAARRRFLKQGTAVGTGILVVTLHHQRAMAGGTTIMTSSAGTCLSLKGTVQGTTQVHNVTNPTGPMVTVTQCITP
jgi:hypothetical protein